MIFLAFYGFVIFWLQTENPNYNSIGLIWKPNIAQILRLKIKFKFNFFNIKSKISYINSTVSKLKYNDLKETKQNIFPRLTFKRATERKRYVQSVVAKENISQSVHTYSVNWWYDIIACLSNPVLCLISIHEWLEG